MGAQPGVTKYSTLNPMRNSVPLQLYMQLARQRKQLEELQRRHAHDQRVKTYKLHECVRCQTHTPARRVLAFQRNGPPEGERVWMCRACRNTIQVTEGFDGSQGFSLIPFNR